ncbi:hypothetical protein N7528_005628 [Penicillium herquei]|nr:hypothetical protein N7528_005628 [Penicillium herquei]
MLQVLMPLIVELSLLNVAIFSFFASLVFASVKNLYLPPPYQESPSLLRYIQQVTYGTLEDRVDHLWSALLLRHFPPSDEFMIERETYSHESSLEKIDIAVTNVIEDRLVKLLLVECQRHTDPAREVD